MTVMETMGNHVASIKDWYNNLDDKSKDTTTVFLVMGDMEGKYNMDFLAGTSIDDLVLTLAQTMINDRDFYTVAKAAVSLTDRYNAGVIEAYKDISTLEPKIVS